MQPGEDFYDNSYLVEQDGKLIRKRPPDDYVCDFCCGPLGESCWTYPCGFLELPLVGDPTGLPAVSDDPWGCCNECYPLVQAKDWTCLALRSIASQLKIAGGTLEDIEPVREALTRQIVKHFQRFDAARTGEPYQEHAPYTEHK